MRPSRSGPFGKVNVFQHSDYIQACGSAGLIRTKQSDPSDHAVQDSIRPFNGAVLGDKSLPNRSRASRNILSQHDERRGLDVQR